MENQRVSGNQTFQRTVLHLGEIGNSQQADWRKGRVCSPAGSAIANALYAPSVAFFTGTATCADDLANGGDPVVPEPSTWMMYSSGGRLAFSRSATLAIATPSTE